MVEVSVSVHSSCYGSERGLILLDHNKTLRPEATRQAIRGGAVGVKSVP